MSNEDAQLITLIAAGGRAREAAMAKFFEKYAARIKLHFLRHKLNAEDASDLLQEVMLKVIKGSASFRSEAKVSTWLWTITNHALMDFLRKPVLDCEHIDSLNESHGDAWQYHASKQADSLSHERKLELLRDECVEHHFLKFSSEFPVCGQALQMKAFESMSISEISVVIKRNEGATREFLSQCRKRLKDFVKPCQSVEVY